MTHDAVVGVAMAAGIILGGALWAWWSEHRRNLRRRRQDAAQLRRVAARHERG